MTQETFSFKKFTIQQDKCAMKVGTDAVLLGALTPCSKHVKTILDIGTGTGILALMLAQKSDAIISAIEIDEDAYLQAKINFITSPWSLNIHAYNIALQQFKPSDEKLFDLIISNPPFYHYNKNIAIQNTTRSVARHNQSLPFEALGLHVKRLLKDDGKFWLILPIQEVNEFIQIAATLDLFITFQFWVQPKKNKLPNRMIACFENKISSITQQNICLYEDDGKATNAYYELTKDYLLWKQR